MLVSRPDLRRDSSEACIEILDITIAEMLFERLGPALTDIRAAVDQLNSWRDTPFGTIRLTVPNPPGIDRLGFGAWRIAEIERPQISYLELFRYSSAGLLPLKSGSHYMFQVLAQRRRRKFLIFHGTFLLRFDLPLIRRPDEASASLRSGSDPSYP